MVGREVRILFGKEWRQLVRSKGAMLSSLLLPLVILVLVPSLQILGITLGESQNKIPADIPLPPALAEVANDPRGMARLMLPLFVSLGGMMVPMLAASYTLVAEREAKTLELLIALPITVGQLLTAKLLALGALAGGVTLTLFSFDAALLLATGLGDVPMVLALVALLLSALFFSMCGALLISLLAKDFRTSNNLNGFLVLPVILLTMGAVVLIPGTAVASLVLSLVFLAGAAACAFVALKVVTFERLLR